jgi:hypothetical protein
LHLRFELLGLLPMVDDLTAALHGRCGPRIRRTGCRRECDLFKDNAWEGVFQIWEALIYPARRLIYLGRTVHVESLMRALLVEDLDELIEASLLLRLTSGWASAEYRAKAFLGAGYPNAVPARPCFH